MRLRFLAAVVLLLSPGAAGADPFGGEGQESSGGFRMEGDPLIVTVFGNTEQFKAYVDRFYTIHDDMEASHEEFSKNVQAALASLSAHDVGDKKKKCPTDAVALAYARAFRYGQAYHTAGKDLEANWISIEELDKLGETTGLTPDYRWKVKKAIKLYGEILVDFKEMKVAFQDQLAGELKYFSCEPAALLVKGEELEKLGPPPTSPTVIVKLDPPKGPDKRQKAKAEKIEPPPAPAKGVTFFVDNSSCGTSLKVFLDDALLGEVGSRNKAAFHTLVGRHDMCLIPSSSKQQCGDQGTLRSAYIHDGWSIALRCD